MRDDLSHSIAHSKHILMNDSGKAHRQFVTPSRHGATRRAPPAPAVATETSLAKYAFHEARSSSRGRSHTGSDDHPHPLQNRHSIQTEKCEINNDVDNYHQYLPSRTSRNHHHRHQSLPPYLPPSACLPACYQVRTYSSTSQPI